MTRLGLGAALAGVAFAVVGWTLVWPALVVVGVGSLVLVLVALAYIVRRPHLHIDRQIHPPRVSKGLPAIAFLHFTNTGARTVPTSVAVQPYGALRVETVLPKLLGGQAGMRSYRLPTTRRGIFTIGPVEISRSDPFEFARVTQRHGGSEQIWVYPHIMPFRPLPSGRTRHLEGPSSDTAPEGSITFHRLREYVVGDDLRMIHWKSTARTGRLMVRHNVDTSQPYTVVQLDLRPVRYSEETFEMAIDVAASAVSCAAVGKSPVQLRTTHGTQVGGPRQREPQSLLDQLTAIEPDERGSIVSDLSLLRRERGGTALIVVTGRLDATDLPAIAGLRRRFQRVVVVSVAPMGTAVPRFPGVTVVTGEDHDELCAAWNLEAAL